jgi:hypothetical protein
MGRFRFFSMRAAALSAATLASLHQATFAESRYWVGSSGNWSSATSWNTVYDGSGASGTPQNGDIVRINNSPGVNYTVTFDSTMPTGTSLADLIIESTGYPTPGYISFQQSQGTLSAGFAEVDTNTGGQYTQSGGVASFNSLLWIGDSINGAYTLSGTGSLTTGETELGNGPMGTFNQTGGTQTTGQLVVGQSTFSSSVTGTYNLSGKSSLLTATNIYVGDSAGGVFAQSGGTVNASTLTVGDNAAGTYNQSGGIVAVASTFNIGVGNSTYWDEGTYNLSGGTLNVSAPEYIGTSVQGTFSQTGAINITNSFLTIGASVGVQSSYSISAGTLNASTMYIGFAQASLAHGGSGTFTQTGGQVSVSDLDVGWEPSATAAYQLQGGTLSTIQSAIGAVGANASFTQIGGTHSASQSIIVWDGASYSLSGTGQVSAPTEEIGGSGTGIFNQTGGSNTMTGSLIVGSTYSSTASGTYTLGGAGQLNAGQVRIGADSGSGKLVWLGGAINTPSLLLGPNGTLAVGYNFNMADLTSGALLKTGGIVSGTSSASLEIANGATAIQDHNVATWGSISVGGTDGSGSLNTSGGQISCGSFTIGVGGSFAQSSGSCSLNSLNLGTTAGTGTIMLSGGQISVGNLNLGGTGTSSLSVTSATTAMSVASNLSIASGFTLSAVPGTTIKLTGGSVVDTATDVTKLAGLNNVSFVFEGGPSVNATLEVVGEDLGLATNGWNGNGALNLLTVGGDGAIGLLKLVDNYDNQPTWSGREALYVNTLVLNPGSSLDLNGLNVYANSVEYDGGSVIDDGGNLSIAPEPSAVMVFGMAACWGMKRTRRREHICFVAR